MSHKKLFTLVFARKDSQLLLGLKKRGFGQGKWNGFGGKLEPGETIHQAAVREMREECGLKIQERNLNHLGHLEFYYQGHHQVMVVKVFSAFKFEGNIIETEEMQPKWFDTLSLPYKNMWPDDKFWLPYILKGIHFVGHFWFQGYSNIIRQELRTVSEDELINMPDMYSDFKIMSRS